MRSKGPPPSHPSKQPATRRTRRPSAVMRQTTLTAALGLHVVNRDAGARDFPPAASSGSGRPAAGHQALVDLLQREEQLTFHAVLPFGHVLKCVSELLLRCAAQTPLTVDGARGLVFLASDPNSGRLIHVCLHRRDMVQFRLYGPAGSGAVLRHTLETGSIHAVFHRTGTTGCGCDIPGGTVQTANMYFFWPMPTEHSRKGGCKKRQDAHCFVTQTMGAVSSSPSPNASCNEYMVMAGPCLFRDGRGGSRGHLDTGMGF